MSADLEHLKDARAMFQRLGIAVPDRDRVKFPNPFRPDSNPSCDIHNGRFKDWTTDETHDGIGVYALSKGISNGDAYKELVGQTTPVGAVNSKFNAAMARTAKPQSVPKPPPFSSLEQLTVADREQLAKLRNIYDGAIDRACAAGHLFAGDTAEGRCWIATDAKRKVCQSRRQDGKKWECLNAKSWTSVKASGWAAWPLGIAATDLRENIILVEGGPDFIVAHESESASPVCMLGASQRIHEEALPLFTAKRVRILAHNDPAGIAACRRWAEQLKPVTKAVTAIVINFGAAKDLNDVTRLTYAEHLRYQTRELLEFMP